MAPSVTEWHEGETKMHHLLHVPETENPTSPGLVPHTTRLLHHSSLLALGVLDDRGRPWTTVLGGEQGFARSLGQSIVGVRTLVDRKFDPVISILLKETANVALHQQGSRKLPISALGYHLATRDRVKLWGTMVAGALETHGSEAGKDEAVIAEAQMVFAIEASIGNCPKYMNKKNIIPTIPRPVLLSSSLPLDENCLALLAKADMFFISSHYGTHMGTNHRGGPPGFVRVARNDPSGATLVYPEYSGNRLYQTLGNLYANPQAGLVFPDYDTGNVLYITGRSTIKVGKDASAALPRSNLALEINVEEARFVERGLSFRAQPGEWSPYNPPVRFLATERAIPDAQTNNSMVAYAKLLARDLLTPTIARFRFSISDPETAGRWTAGQYVALAFEDELSSGWSHMRDDDPKSLNDDYVRTFTVSSSSRDLPRDEFEITIRNVGAVTGFMFRQNVRASLEVPLRGFGGSFTVSQGQQETVPFVAGGIGITPLLAQLPELDLERLLLFWTVNVRDIGLVVDTFDRCPALATSTRLFISGIGGSPSTEVQDMIEDLRGAGTEVGLRRILASDVKVVPGISSTWYLCTGTALRKSLLGWLQGQKAVYEDFDY